MLIPKLYKLKNITFIHSQVKLPLLDLPVQTVVVELVNARVLISPGSQLTENQLDQIGPIHHIIAPSLLHCGGIEKAQKVFPDAKLWGPPQGRTFKSQIKWDFILFSDEWPFQNELLIHEILGMPKINEIVFFHQQSQSMIVTDLCFNLTKVKGIGAWTILNLFGTYKKFAISKLYLKYVTDQSAFKKSVNDLLNLDFENIILSHGENVIGNGKDIFLSALKKRDLA